jgi:hypothetical protein
MAGTELTEWKPGFPFMESVANALRKGRDWANQYEVKPWVPLIGGTGLGDMVMGRAPEGITRIAYNEPLTTGSGWTLKPHPDVTEAGLLGLSALDVTKAPLKGLARGVAENALVPTSRAAGQLGGVGFHSSPKKFSAFSNDYLGSGPTGYQVRGQGHYVAQNPEVAGPGGFYHRLAGSHSRENPNTVTYQGKPTLPQQGWARTPQDMAESILRSNNGDVDSSLVALTQRMSDNQIQLESKLRDSRLFNNAPQEMQNEIARELEEATELLRMQTESYKWLLKNRNDYSFKPGGFTYKVQYPDETFRNMLHWDAPLEMQPKAMAKLPYTTKELASQLPFNPNLREAAPGTGGEYYNKLANKMGGLEAATGALRESNIPGIRYLDKYHRGNPDIGVWPPTTQNPLHNMIFFNDTDLRILERNQKEVSHREIINELEKRARKRMGKDW